jgi:hypothetical protein
MKTIIPSKAIIFDSKKLFEYPIRERFLRFSLHVLILRISVFSFIVPLHVLIRALGFFQEQKQLLRALLDAI